MKRFLSILLLSMLLSCKRAEVVDICLEEPERCPACEADSECGFTGNPCTDTVYCAHEDAEIAVIDIGCSKALERRWPDDDQCACIEDTCQSR